MQWLRGDVKKTKGKEVCVCGGAATKGWTLQVRQWWHTAAITAKRQCHEEGRKKATSKHKTTTTDGVYTRKRTPNERRVPVMLFLLTAAALPFR
jgi:hypothetical protein